MFFPQLWPQGCLNSVICGHLRPLLETVSKLDSKPRKCLTWEKQQLFRKCGQEGHCDQENELSETARRKWGPLRLTSTERTVSPWCCFHAATREWTASRSRCCGIELKNLIKSSLITSKVISSEATVKCSCMARQIFGTESWPKVCGQSCTHMESMVRAVTCMRTA